MLTTFHLLYTLCSNLYLGVSKQPKQCHIVLTWQILSGKSKCLWFSWCGRGVVVRHWWWSTGFCAFHECWYVVRLLIFVLSSSWWYVIGAVNRPGKAEGARTREEITAKHRFRKQQNSDYHLPSQNSRAGGWAPDPNSRKPMLTVEARGMKVVLPSGEVRASVSLTSAGMSFDLWLFVR